MLDDLYLMATIGRHRVLDSRDAPPHAVRAALLPGLHRWGGKWLRGVTVSGSYAKGTAIRGLSLAPSDVDVDLFLSLAAEMPESLADMQLKLCAEFGDYQPRIANVSVRLLYENRRVDLVPGRRRENSEDHSLWRRREAAWVRTNVAEQVRWVRESRRQDEILALRIWRRGQALYFPSFCLELAVIEALQEARGHGLGFGAQGLAARVLRVLQYLAEEFPGAVLRDPANRSNVVSGLMSTLDKQRVASAAWVSLRADSWPDIL